ncbi:hypothetical protein L6452_34049 [Arctium lappa]|uniref:Uncharacterized protein n=1 Tax=Arctium lappa TaxID=4217 RepID=A0ACB8YHA6_ARCLA|nr:hypothetical protein L6452_34049 [Arctium lappa]
MAPRRFPISLLLSFSYSSSMENHTRGLLFFSILCNFRFLLPISSVEKGGDQMELVNLDGTDEYLTGISGFYGPVYGYNGLEAITSITFHTNKKTHGPYGEEIGEGYTYFTSTASPGKVVGFHGRNYGFLSAIGVHMDYF